MGVMKELLGEDVRMAISGSKGIKNKSKFYSYHIVFPDIVFKDLQQMLDSGMVNYIKHITKGKEHVEQDDYNGIDDGIYKKNQAFKLIFQKKKKGEGDDRIQKIIKDNKIENHIVQLLPSASYPELDKALLEKLKPYQPNFQMDRETKKIVRVK